MAAITYEWRLSFQDILSYLNPAQASLAAAPRERGGCVARAAAGRARCTENDRKRMPNGERVGGRAGRVCGAASGGAATSRRT